MKLQNTTQALKVGLFGLAIILSTTLLSGCGDRIIQGTPGVTGNTGATGETGATGATGSQGFGTGIKTSVLAPGATCAAGGVQLETYQDKNNNGALDSGEGLLALNFVCHGTNGTNGSNGTNGTNGTNGQDGTNGTNGQNGADGSNGQNGADGHDGHDGANGANGANGADGQNGTNGTNGTNGVSTTFGIVADSGAHCANGGWDITLTDSSHSETEYVCNGTNGSNGQNGQAGTNGTNGANGGTVSFSLVQAIMPCGASSSPWKEVILGLQGGQLLSSFSETASGLNTRFSFIPNGSYTDTDSSGCHFTVSGDGATTSDISWSGGGYTWTAALGWVSHL